ncbi:MAG: DUF4189 domain-containing protein [Pseudomonadota bacterium]
MAGRLLQLFAILAFGAALVPAPALAQSDSFTSIAYSQSTNAVGYAYDAPSQEAAERDALARCSEHADDCQVVNWSQNACSALSVQISGNGGWGADWGETFREASNNAQQECLSHNTACQPFVWVCNSSATPN